MPDDTMGGTLFTVDSARESEIDIFISYARADDKVFDPVLARPAPVDQEGNGFVTRLVEAIRHRFTRSYHDKIFFDRRKIDPSDQFDEKIKQALTEAKILLVVLSPHWLASRNCRNELDWFIDSHGRKGGIKKRIVIVRKVHIFGRKGEIPDVLSGQEGFKFYDHESEYHTEYCPWGEVDFRFREAFRERALQLTESLRKKIMEFGPPSRPSPEDADDPSPRANPPHQNCKPTPNGRTVFIAKPALDMRRQYLRVVRELEFRGYRVLPDPHSNLPTEDGHEARTILNDALSASEISIHLLGEKQGYAPSDEKSIVPLQLDLAGARVDASGREGGTEPHRFRRMIWAPETVIDLEIVDRKPVEVLERFAEMKSTDMVAGQTLSEFVSAVIDHLNKHPPRVIQDSNPAPKGSACVYFRYNKDDSDEALNVMEAFAIKGNVEILYPPFDGDEEERARLHGKYLSECDAIVVPWARASETWVLSELEEHRSSNWSDLGRKRPFRCRSVITLPPPESKKRANLLLPRQVDIFVNASDRDVPIAELVKPIMEAIHGHTQRA